MIWQKTVCEITTEYFIVAEKRSTVYTHQEEINNNRLREIHPLSYTHQEEIKHKLSKLYQEKPICKNYKK